MANIANWGGFVTAVALVAWGSPADAHSPLPADEALVAADCQDGRLDTFRFTEAALVACRASSAARAECLARISALVEEVERSHTPGRAPREQLQTLHRVMHERILVGGYLPRQNDLAVAILDGQFNCLSATALLVALGECAGLNVVAVASQGHIRPALVDDDELLVIESTQVPWTGSVLDLGRLPPVHRIVSPARLPAAFYFNRAAAHLATGQFETAIAEGATAVRIDPDCPLARENLLAAYNNWGVAVARQGQVEQSLEILRQGTLLDPAYEPFRANRQYIERHRADLTAGRL